MRITEEKVRSVMAWVETWLNNNPRQLPLRPLSADYCHEDIVLSPPNAVYLVEGIDALALIIREGFDADVHKNWSFGKNGYHMSVHEPKESYHTIRYRCKASVDKILGLAERMYLDDSINNYVLSTIADIDMNKPVDMTFEHHFALYDPELNLYKYVNNDDWYDLYHERRGELRILK